jgi:hypothetical protein
MTNCEKHFLAAGVLYPVDGGFGENVCHPMWLSYWMHCQMPTYTMWGNTFDLGAFWEEAGKLIKIANCAWCIPDCEGKECGPDGCGGNCGYCSRPEDCVDGECVCTPDCEGKECGPDGCGGNCGYCPRGEDCIDGMCACEPNCEGKECGSDGCEGECGFCPSSDETCTDGICVCNPACVDLAEQASLKSSLDPVELEELSKCLCEVFKAMMEAMEATKHNWVYKLLDWEPQDDPEFVPVKTTKLTWLTDPQSEWEDFTDKSNCAAVLIGPSLSQPIEPHLLSVRLYYFFETRSWVPSDLSPGPDPVWTLLFAQEAYIDADPDQGWKNYHLESCLETYRLIGQALQEKYKDWSDQPGFSLWYLQSWGASWGKADSPYPYDLAQFSEYDENTNCADSLGPALAAGEAVIQWGVWSENSRVWPSFLDTGSIFPMNTSSAYCQGALSILKRLLSWTTVYKTNIVELKTEIGWDEEFPDEIECAISIRYNNNKTTSQIANKMDSEGWDDVISVLMVNQTTGVSAETWLYFKSKDQIPAYDEGSAARITLLYYAYAWFGQCGNACEIDDKGESITDWAHEHLIQV